METHIHDSPEVIPICEDHLRGICKYGDKCPEHHSSLPYIWQVRSHGVESVDNKKSRTYSTSDLSIYQLCYHITWDPLLIHPRSALGDSEPLIGSERSHDFWEQIPSREQIGSGSLSHVISLSQSEAQNREGGSE